jgi:hypothetical protein
MKIAFGHKSRVGKDTAVNYLINKFGGIVIRFAEPLHNINRYIFDELDMEQHKDPVLLQNLGMLFRELYGDDIFVNIAEKKIVKHLDYNIFIPDLRFQNEFDMLKKYGFKIIFIHRDNRIIDRDPTCISENELNHLDTAPDVLHIQNNNTINNFTKNLLNLIV